MSENKDVKLLRQKLVSKEKEARKLRWAFEEAENKKLLPGLKKKYEGKYFKYDNGYNSNDRWWLYVHCKGVKSVNKFVVNNFQTTPHSFEFKLNENSYEHLCQVPITRAEYTRQLKKFLQKASTL